MYFLHLLIVGIGMYFVMTIYRDKEIKELKEALKESNNKREEEALLFKNTIESLLQFCVSNDFAKTRDLLEKYKKELK